MHTITACCFAPIVLGLPPNWWAPELKIEALFHCAGGNPVCDNIPHSFIPLFWDECLRVILKSSHLWDMFWHWHWHQHRYGRWHWRWRWRWRWPVQQIIQSKCTSELFAPITLGEMGHRLYQCARQNSLKAWWNSKHSRPKLKRLYSDIDMWNVCFSWEWTHVLGIIYNAIGK